MRIVCPFCGERDAHEFSYLGDASLQRRPEGPAQAAAIDEAMMGRWHDYVYLRANTAEAHEELWYHAAGCRRWLKVTRDLRTHRISGVEAARTVAQRRGAE
jgi:heterotetrameric sarcosine oxidase delta subunit